MAIEYTRKSFIGKKLRKDIYTDNDVLLIAQGTVLQEKHIEVLNMHQIKTIPIEDSWISSFTDASSTVEFEKVSPSQSKKYLSTLGDTKKLFYEIANGNSPTIESFNEAFLPLMNDILKNTDFFNKIYTIEGSEDYTFKHSINVGLLSALISKLLKRTPEDIALMGQAGLVHDIGKIMTPAEILLKPGRLTAEEYKIMKQHSEDGYRILSEMPDIHSVMLDCTLNHHERLDGRGYPHGKRKDDISLEAQILAVADIFDAVCSDRVYKKKTSPFQAATILWDEACRGALNPEITSKFIHYVLSIYISSSVKLSDGRTAEIVLIHQDEPFRPLIQTSTGYIDLRKNRDLSIESLLS